MHTQFKILEEDIDENYEPSREGNQTKQIIQKSLSTPHIQVMVSIIEGMSPRSDSKYFHIAREGLKTPLPTPWKPVELRNGEIFYFNPQTQVLQEQHPLDDHFKRKYIEEKKKDSSFNQPSKTSKKLKGLCEKLRDTEDTTQKTEKKQSQRAEIRADISGLSESTYFKEQTDALDNKFKFELLQYEREQESFLEIYKMSQARQLEQGQSELQEISYETTTNIPEKAIKIRQDYLNKKEEMKQRLQDEYERKIATEKELLNQKSIIQNKEHIAAKQLKNSERLEQMKRDYENQIANKQKANKELERDLKQKQIQHELISQQKEKELLLKWQTVQKRYKQELEKEFTSLLQKLEQQQTSQQNEVSYSIRQQKAQHLKQLQDFYNGDSEFQIKKRWRDIYKEKIELYRVSQAQEMEDELKNEEISLYEQMTDNVIKYKNLIRQNLVRMKQQQIDNERLYYSNFYKEQLQNYKHDCTKKVELQIQKLELNQIVISNESFTKLDKSQSKVFNPDLRIQKKDLELQIQEYKSKIDDYKSHLYQIKTLREESQFINQVLNQEDRIDFLQQSLKEKDKILNELTRQIIQEPYVAEPQESKMTKNIKSDQWSQQIEQERQWLNLQKERLKYDKKQLKKYYEKLTLLTSTNEDINSYNKSVNTVRNNQQIIKNCEYIIRYLIEFYISKLLENLKQYYQTKIIKYLHENDTLLEDLQAQKQLLESVLQMPIESNILYKSYRIGSASLHQNELNTSQLQSFTNNQKQLLRDMKDYLNKSMQSRLC